MSNGRGEAVLACYRRCLERQVQQTTSTAEVRARYFVQPAFAHCPPDVLSRNLNNPCLDRLRKRGEAKQVDHWRRDLNAYIKYIDQGDPYSLTPTRSWDSLESKKTAFEEKGFLYPEDVALYNRACQLKRGVTGSTAQGSSAGTVRSRGPQCPTTGANPAQGVTVPGIPGQSIATNPSNRSLIPSQPVQAGKWMTSQRPVPVNPLGSGPPRPIPPGNQGNQGYRVAKPARVSRAPTNPTGQWGQQRQAGISPGPPQPLQRGQMQRSQPVDLQWPSRGPHPGNPVTPRPYTGSGALPAVAQAGQTLVKCEAW